MHSNGSSAVLLCHAVICFSITSQVEISQNLSHVTLAVLVVEW